MYDDPLKKTRNGVEVESECNSTSMGRDLILLAKSLVFSVEKSNIGKDKKLSVRTYPSSSLVVVEVHHEPGALHGALGVGLLALTRVHKLLGEAVAVHEVVTAAAPQPVAGQLLGAGGAAAAATGELALPAGAAHRVHHPRRADGVRERRLPATCGNKQTNIHTHSE